MKIVKLSQLDFDLDFNDSRLPEMFEFLRISKISILIEGYAMPRGRIELVGEKDLIVKFLLDYEIVNDFEIDDYVDMMTEI